MKKWMWLLSFILHLIITYLLFQGLIYQKKIVRKVIYQEKNIIKSIDARR